MDALARSFEELGSSLIGGKACCQLQNSGFVACLELTAVAGLQLIESVSADLGPEQAGRGCKR